MGLLDGILGGSNANAGGGGGIPGMLMGLLGGQGAATQGGAGGMLGGLLGGGGGSAGGLGQLVNMFEQQGMGHIAQSWVGNGANQPVSPDQLHQVLGADQVQQMASQTGMQPNDLLSRLSQMLPNAVHQATPDGQLPASGGSEPMFDSAKA
jgi:uncharacterized protein YidB (DUF937 family)